MILHLKWEEPETDQCFVDAPVSAQDVKDLISYLKSSSGNEYGVTIPSIHSADSGINVESVDMHGLASSVRYCTGEGIFSNDFPLFAANGIVRS